MGGIMKMELQDKSDKEIITMVGKWIIIGIVGLIFLFGTFYTIPAGSRGVLTTFGKPSMDAKGEGLHMKFPLIQGVVKMQVQTMKYEAELTAASKDLQDVKTKIAINYHLLPSEVPKIYQEIGKDYSDKLIYPLEQETNKASTSLFTAEELVTKREIVKETMKNTLAEKLRPRGIIVEEISIINFAFGDVFTQAIEQKVTSTQLMLKAEKDLERIKIEKQQIITKAEAEAEALRLQKMQINSELIQLRQIEMQSKAIDKWNGVMPLATSGMPFLDLSQFTTKQGVAAK